MIKTFKELYDIDNIRITKKPVFEYDKATQKMVQTGTLDTLGWADCLKLLYENGAKKVIYESIPNEKGALLYIEENGAVSIKVFVEIDGDRREIFYPILNGTKPVALDKITQNVIYVCKQRAFVKCVAVNWGLALRLWQKDDTDDENIEEEKRATALEDFRAVLNNAVAKLGGIKELLKHLPDTTEKELHQLVESSQKIDRIMKTLTGLTNDQK